MIIFQIIDDIVYADYVAVSYTHLLPDKAIDLIDEAAARIRTEIDSMPAELDEISRKIMQLEIEKQALDVYKRQAFALISMTLSLSSIQSPKSIGLVISM